MTSPTLLVILGWLGMVVGIGLLSIPWALIIGGASLMALGFISAKARIDARIR